MTGRVLVVDDERLNRRLLEVVLGAEGYDVLEAADGAAALAVLAREPVDLVLLDVMMPGLDGVEVCRRIRDDLRLPLVPIVMLTALTDGAWRSRARAAGADDFLTKPLDEDELLQRVKNLLLVRAYYQLSETRRREAESEARRWRLVSQVAGAVAQCRDHAALLAAIVQALAPELGVTGAAFFPAGGDPRTPAATVGTGASAHPAPGNALSPVTIGGVPYGVVALSRVEPFSRADHALLDELAIHVANAVANVRSQLMAEALAASRRQWAHLLVHDFKNPLFAIRLNLDLLDEPRLDDVPEARAEAMHDLRGATDRLLGMTMDLLDIGCAEDGRLVLDRRPVAVAPLLEDAAELVRSQARRAQVAVRTAAPAGLAAALDRRLVQRVLQNLLDNALRYVPGGGAIELEAMPHDGGVMLRVGNDGPPIPTELRDGLFDKYARVESAAATANRGMGLYLCRLVAEAHGGTIRVVDRPGGVAFALWLPAPPP